MAAGDIVPVPGDSFEQTLASASPDMLREMAATDESLRAKPARQFTVEVTVSL